MVCSRTALDAIVAIGGLGIVFRQSLDTDRPHKTQFGNFQKNKNQSSVVTRPGAERAARRARGDHHALGPAGQPVRVAQVPVQRRPPPRCLGRKSPPLRRERAARGVLFHFKPFAAAARDEETESSQEARRATIESKRRTPAKVSLAKKNKCAIAVVTPVFY